MNKEKKRLFLDMDGVSARFYIPGCIEGMKEPGFFRNLEPYENLCEAIRIIRKNYRQDVHVYILSAVDDNDASEDKMEWATDQFGTIGCFFTDFQTSKADCVERASGRKVSKNDYLLDDYSKNLVEWESAGGVAIKFRNELNGRGWNGYNFRGHTVFFDQEPEELAHDLLVILGIIEEKKAQPDILTEEKLRRDVDSIMEKQLGWDKVADGWEYTFYACYDDAISNRTLHQIFSSDDPDQAFAEQMYEWYDDEEYTVRAHLINVLREELSDLGSLYDLDGNEFADSEVENMFVDLVQSDFFTFSLPFDHYLKQRIKINVMIDTGDGNRDYVENCIYPHWDANQGDEISDKASLVWLAGTQGISKDELVSKLNAFVDQREQTGFLNTVGQELINAGSRINILTFLVEMTLQDALAINEAFIFEKGKLDQRFMVLNTRTMTGLFDPWSGSGSLFEIELEKDVKIPLSIIRSVKPDGCDGIYSVSEVYGMCGNAWNPTMKELVLSDSAKSN